MSEWIAALQEFFKAVWSYGGVQFICVGVILNAVLAIAAAIKTDNFTFREIGTFLYKQLLPLVAVYAVAGLVTAGTDFEWIPGAVLVAITAAIGSRIVEHLRDLGVPIPDAVTKLTAPPVQYLVVSHEIPAVLETAKVDDGPTG